MLDRNFQAQDELVPNACLSPSLSDYLLDIAEDKRDLDYSNHLHNIGFISMLSLPSILAGIGYAAISLKNPNQGINQGLIFNWLISDFITAIGFAHITINAIQQECTIKSVLIYASSFTVPHILVSTLLGVTVEFPTTLNYVWSFTIGSFSATLTLILFFFTKKFTQHSKIIYPMCGASTIPIVFLFCFVFFRAAFVGCGKFQVLLSPVWFGIKVGLKGWVRKLVKKGHNPDIGPFLLYGVDAVAAFCGCLLFLDASGGLVVLAMIAFDEFENFFNIVKIGSLVSQARQIKMERKHRERVDEILRLEEVLEMHEKRIFNLEERLDEDGNFKAPTVLPFGVRGSRGAGVIGIKRSEMLEGHSTVLMFQALNSTLSYAASEFSSICSSCCACFCVTMFYYSSNKAYFGGIAGFDNDTDADFNEVMGYLGIRLFSGVVCFVFSMTYLHKSTGLSVVKVAGSYLYKKNLFLSVLAVVCMVPFAGFAVIIKHNGCDAIV